MKHSVGLLGVVIAIMSSVACSSTTEGDAETAPSNFDAESPTDETKSTHLWLVNRGIDILAKHTGDLPNAANTLAWMQDAQCRKNWQHGLLEADFLAPFNGGALDLTVPNGGPADEVESAEADFEVAAAHASWMSHFYDPATGKNYLGFSSSSDIPDDPIEHPAYALIKSQIEVNGPVPVEAKGAALYRAKRALDLLSGIEVKSDHPNEPTDARSRGCYELGLALHYFTDLAQPMHSSNYAATNRPRLLHSHWESYAEEVQSKFVRSDWSAPPKGDLEAVVQSTAVASKAHWVDGDGKPGALFASVLDAYRAGGTWDDDGTSHSDGWCFKASAELFAGDIFSSTGFITLDLPKCWQKNPAVLKETGAVLGDAQEHAARFLATLALPPHSR